MPVPILMYHAIAPERSALAIPPEIFAAQMAWLHDEGFRVLDLGDLAEPRGQEESLPDKSVVITFDDAFASVYEHAFPVLARYGFPATVFAVTGYCGGFNDWPSQPAGFPTWPLMTWARLDEISRHGLVIGAHTVNHPFLDQIPPDEARREIEQAKLALEERLGRACDRFAYPYGHYNAAVRANVAAQFAVACTTELRQAVPADNRHTLPRVEAFYLRQPRLFRTLGTPLFPPYLQLRHHLRALRPRWA